MGNNTFPIHVFPRRMQEICEQLHKTLGFHLDYLGTSMLVAAAASIGKTRRLLVKGTWDEAPVFYVILVGKPGAGKTHPLIYCIKPLLNATERYMDRMADEANESSGNFTAEEMMSTEIPIPSEEIDYQITLSNFTMEAMHRVMNQGGDRLIIWSDEIAGFLRNLNKYRKGSDEQDVLSIYSGTDITVNRVTSPPIYIKKPFACIAGSTQPAVLTEIFQKAVANGLRDRFLFSFPDDVSKAHLNTLKLDPTVTASYHEIIEKLLSYKTVNGEAKIVEMTEEAYMEGTKWFNANADMVNIEVDEKIATLFLKLDSGFFRTALVLHELYRVCDGEQSEDVGMRAVKAAKDVMEYYRYMGLKVLKLISPDPYEAMTELQNKVYRALKPEFTTFQGKQTAVVNGMSERSFFYFLKNTQLFKRIKGGMYTKLL